MGPEAGGMPAPASSKGSVGIRTSGLVLKGLVKRAGFMSQETWGAEKLDLLVFLADQVKDNVKGQVKMDLALQDLNDFLLAEDMSPKQGDAKHAIEQFLSLRSRELRRRGVVEPDDDDVCLDCLSESDVRGLFAVVPMAASFEAVVKGFASSFTGNRAEQVAAYGKEEEGEDTSNNIEQSEVPLEAGDMPAPASSKGDGGEFYVKYSPQWSAVMERKLKSRGMTSASDITVNTCDGMTLELVFHDGVPQVSATPTMFPLKITF